MCEDGELPTAADIIEVHDLIEGKYDLKYTGTMKAAPRAKLRREVVEQAQEYEDPYYRAAVLLFKIPSVHVFEDGNKRTAWTATVRYLERKGVEEDLPQNDEEIEKVVRRAGLFYPDELAEWFRTGNIDVSNL